MYLAGIDVGTTGCKCSVYTDLGEFVDEAYQEYEIHVTEFEHTIDPKIIWDGVKKVVKEIANKVKVIESICITSFGEASIWLDQYGEPLTNAYLFTDPNGSRESCEIVNEVGADYIYQHMGLTPGKMYSAVKWKWQKKQTPDLWKKTSWICLIEDYIVYRLSGVRQIDYTLAARTMAFDIHKLCWDDAILKAVGVSEQMLSKLVPTGTAAEVMQEEVRKELGFDNRPLIVSGCHDQIAAAIGSGVLKRTQAVDGTGTVECITCAFSKLDKSQEKLLSESGYAVVPYGKDLYVTYAYSFTGGAMLKWYRDKLAFCEAESMKRHGESPYEVFNNSIQMDRPSGLLVLPYFAGAGTPYMNPNAKGVIVGLTIDTTKAQIYQGLMEGAAYEMRLNMERLEQAGVPIEELYATGGGANSSQWLQIKADIYGKRVVPLGVEQSGTIACIMLAGVACGKFQSLEEATNIFVTRKDCYEPREEVRKKYENLYHEYKQIYPNLYYKEEKTEK